MKRKTLKRWRWKVLFDQNLSCFTSIDYMKFVSPAVVDECIVSPAMVNESWWKLFYQNGSCKWCFGILENPASSTCSKPWPFAFKNHGTSTAKPNGFRIGVLRFKGTTDPVKILFLRVLKDDPLIELKKWNFPPNPLNCFSSIFPL